MKVKEHQGWEIEIDRTAKKSQIKYNGKRVDFVEAVSVHCDARHTTGDSVKAEIKVVTPRALFNIEDGSVYMSNKDEVVRMIKEYLKQGLITVDDIGA